MNTTVKTANDDIRQDSVQWFPEGEMHVMVGKSGYYSEVYREMAELIGEAAVIKLWRSYSGLTVTFPRQLYSREYIREYIRGNMGVLKPSEIARNVGMTERRVRQIIHDLKKEGGTDHGKNDQM